MALTPEQFNRLTTKDEFNELRSEVQEIKEDVKKILHAVDGLAKNTGDIKEEFISNIGAHDRFEKRMTRIEKSLELKPATE